jgi:hypothetical protein
VGRARRLRRHPNKRRRLRHAAPGRPRHGGGRQPAAARNDGQRKVVLRQGAPLRHAALRHAGRRVRRGRRVPALVRGVGRGVGRPTAGQRAVRRADARRAAARGLRGDGRARAGRRVAAGRWAGRPGGERGGQGDGGDLPPRRRRPAKSRHLGTADAAARLVRDAGRDGGVEGGQGAHAPGGSGDGGGGSAVRGSGGGGDPRSVPSG